SSGSWWTASSKTNHASPTTASSPASRSAVATRWRWHAPRFRSSSDPRNRRCRRSTRRTCSRRRRCARRSTESLWLLIPSVLRKRESDDRVAHPAAVGIFEGEVVSIGYVSTKGIGNEFAPVRDVGHRGSRGSTHVRDSARVRIKGKEDGAVARVRRLELSVALAEEQ